MADVQPANPFGDGLTVVPLPQNNSLVNVLATTGNPVTDFHSVFIAFAVLIFLTLSLPKQWGIWLPIMVLLAYGANRAGLINYALSSIGIPQAASVKTGTIATSNFTGYLDQLISEMNFGSQSTNTLPTVSYYDNTNPVDVSNIG